ACMMRVVTIVCFFLQAEDGIRDFHVTGVQTCALPIFLHGYDREAHLTEAEKQAVYYVICSIQMICIAFFESHDIYKELAKTNRRSEERRVGKECRSRWKGEKWKNKRDDNDVAVARRTR